VAFCDFNGHGLAEIVVGWQVGPLRVLSVYTLEDGGLTEILTSPFHEYTIYDMEGTGEPALLIIRADAAEQVAEMASGSGAGLAVVSSALLSRGAEAVRRIRTGPLLDGRPGLLVTSQYQTAGEVTDVLTFRGGGLVNISVNLETGVSDALVRQREIAAYDIDGSGVYSIPQQSGLPRHPDEDDGGGPYYEIYWTAYESSGLAVETARTYHSAVNNWFIMLPGQWPERYTVRRRAGAPSQAVTTFSLLTDDGEAIDFLHIYFITQPRSARPPVRDRTVLAEQDNIMVTAEIIPLKDGLSVHNISETELRALFSLIPADWRNP
jgi:hypothetical protein